MPRKALSKFTPLDWAPEMTVAVLIDGKRALLDLNKISLPRKLKSLSEYETLVDKFSRLFMAVGLNGGTLRTRDKYIFEIELVAKFLEEIGYETKTVAARLRELKDGLAELNYGIVRPYLKPSARSGRTLDPGNIWMARARFAALVDRMRLGGMSRKEACRSVASDPEFPFLAEVLAPKAKSVASAIEHWHRLFIAGAVKSADAQAWFNECISSGSRYSDADYFRWVKLSAIGSLQATRSI